MRTTLCSLAVVACQRSCPNHRIGEKLVHFSCPDREHADNGALTKADAEAALLGFSPERNHRS